jgi:hypothetical protein
MCGFSLLFSITQRAAVDRRGPMLAADSRGVTGQGVAAAPRCPSTCERTSQPPIARSCRIGRALHAAEADADAGVGET